MIYKEFGKVPSYIGCAIIIWEFTFQERKHFLSVGAVDIALLEPANFLMWKEFVDEIEDFFIRPLFIIIVVVVVCVNIRSIVLNYEEGAEGRTKSAAW